ncbi:MAG: DUF1311 domain-containing protein [Sulfurovum sp.]
MTKPILLLTLFIYTTLNAEGIICKFDGNQAQMNQCAYEEFQQADRELNIVYKAIRKKNKAVKEYIQNLKVSQRLWIKFRDAELNMIFTCPHKNSRICFGSMYELLFYEAKKDLTLERVKNLKKYILEGEL